MLPWLVFCSVSLSAGVWSFLAQGGKPLFIGTTFTGYIGVRADCDSSSLERVHAFIRLELAAHGHQKPLKGTKSGKRTKSGKKTMGKKMKGGNITLNAYNANPVLSFNTANGSSVSSHIIGGVNNHILNKGDMGYTQNETTFI